jgi:anti-sigma-K factor RskA
VSATEHQRHFESAAAYVLGALPELEERAFERHLMGCGECQQEVARLRPAVDALARSPEQFQPPPGLRESLIREAGADAQAAPDRAAPPRRRLALPSLGIAWPRLAGAVAALVVAGALAGVGIDRATRGGSSPSARTVAASTRLPGASARLELRDGHGTLRVAGMPTLAPGRVYEVWIQHGASVRPAGALFEVHSDGSGAAAVPRALRPGDRVMVTRERAGGVAMPTEQPIVVARA